MAFPVGFAVAAYRAACELSHQAGRSYATRFIDFQAALNEASRSLVFEDGPFDAPQDGLPIEHLRVLRVAADFVTRL